MNNLKQNILFTTIFISILSNANCQTNWQSFTTHNSTIPDDYITEIKADKKGNIWAAGTLYLSKYDGTKWISWYLDTLVSGFPYIQDIDFDSYNNIWLASDAGVIRFNGYNTWTLFNTTNSGITFELVQSVEVCPDNTIWCGDVNSERVAKLIGSSWITYTMPGLPSGTGTSVYSIDSYNDQVWFSWGEYLMKHDNTGWSKFDLVNSPIDHGFLGDVYVDSTGTLWTTQTRDFYTLSSGLLMGFDGSHWTVFDSTNCPSLVNGNYTFAPDSGAIWLGNYGVGITRFNGTSYQNFNTTNSILKSDKIIDLDIDKNGNILIATDSGVVVYNEKGIKIGYNQKTSPGEGFELNLFPNPTSDVVTITWDNSFVKPTINLYSICGQLVYSQQFQQPPAVLNTRLFANGVYDVSFGSGQKTVNKKLVIQHE